ncbi:hypothetical protein D3C76_1758090 [compost metagenome]
MQSLKNRLVWQSPASGSQTNALLLKQHLQGFRHEPCPKMHVMYLLLLPSCYLACSVIGLRFNFIANRHYITIVELACESQIVVNFE